MWEAVMIHYLHHQQSADDAAADREARGVEHPQVDDNPHTARAKTLMAAAGVRG